MSHFFLTEQETEMKVQEALREAGRRRLLREARIDQRGWLPRQGCRLLCRMGRLLVTLGQQLQRLGPPQTLLLEGQINRSMLSGNGK
jgi:hypothetical protein